jgi:hypothetical protein
MSIILPTKIFQVKTIKKVGVVGLGTLGTRIVDPGNAIPANTAFAAFRDQSCVAHD